MRGQVDAAETSAAGEQLSSAAWLTRDFRGRPGTATGIGSMPGENPMEAAQLIHDELPDLPYLAELPGRGPGADMIGRTAALLVDIPVEVIPRGWRIADHPGRDMRRARTMLSSDLDAMEEVLDGYQGPMKIQLAGPMDAGGRDRAAHSLNPALADPGLVADLAASLAEGASRARRRGGQACSGRDRAGAVRRAVAARGRRRRRSRRASGLSRVRVADRGDAPGEAAARCWRRHAPTRSSTAALPAIRSR